MAAIRAGGRFCLFLLAMKILLAAPQLEAKYCKIISVNVETRSPTHDLPVKGSRADNVQHLSVGEQGKK